MINKRYPLDLTGKSSTNLVVGETHTLDIDTDDRLIVPRYTAYFDESLIVKQNGNPLVLNKDYAYSLFWQEATHRLGLGVSLAIEIINKDLFGELELSYQVVGGEYQDDREAVLSTLSRFTTTSKRKTYWEDVQNIPEAFVPTRHLHHVDDIYGMGDVCAILNEILNAIGKTTSSNLRNVYDRILKLKQYIDANLSKLDGIDERISSSFNSLNERMNEYVTPEQLTNTLMTQLEVVKNDISADVSGLERQLTNVNEALSNSITTLGNRLNVQEQASANIANWQREHQAAENQRFTEIDNRLNALTDSVSASTNNLINTVNSKLNEAKNNVNALLNGLREEVNQTTQTLRTDVNLELANLETRTIEYTNDKEIILRDEITQKFNEVTRSLQTEVAALTAADAKNREYVTTLESNTLNQINDIRNALENKEEKITATNERITALEEKVDKPAEKQPLEIDPELLDRLVNLSMDRRIVELRRSTGEEPRIEDTYVIPAFTETVTDTYPDGRQIRTYSLKDTNNQSVTETTRTIYAPAKVYEFTNSINWAVPDAYDGVLARVVLSSPVAVYPAENNLVKIIPSVLKETFVVLRKNTTVAITINETETSFGCILSYTASNPDTEGLLQSSFPIFAMNHDSYAGLNKLGRVLLYV